MWPIIASFSFVSIGFTAITLIVAMAIRGPLTDRMGRWGIAVSLLGGVAIASVAAGLKFIPWTGIWTITSYGVCLLAGAIAATVVVSFTSKRDDLLAPRQTQVTDLTFMALMGGLIGARVRYVWENLDHFRTTSDGLDWKSMLDIDQGGMVWYGGLIGGALAVAGLALRRGIPCLALADAVTPGVLIGLAFGRLGCFLNGCCYGKACSLPWAVQFPEMAHPRHPAQLYETGVTTILAILLFIIHRRSARPGTVAGLGLITYGMWRFFNESLRDDYRHAGTLNDLGGWIVTNSQITSMWVVVGGCVLTTWARYRVQTKPLTSPKSPPAPRN